MLNIKNKISVLLIYLKMKFKYGSKKLFLIGTPWYGNLGDQAIAIGELQILRDIYSNIDVVDVPYNVYVSKIKKLFGLSIKPDEMIFLQGGGNLGSLYPQEEQLRRDVINKYKNNKIIVMPVSIFFHNNDFGKNELEKSRRIYNNHSNLTIISRDEVSFTFAKKYFDKVNNVLAPDVVTYLDGIVDNKKITRKGVQFFLRKDIEKVLSNDVVDKIKKYLIENGITYNFSDTTVTYEVKNYKRKKEVFSRLFMAKKSRLVITDRYHGLIFSVITHTPVIVFKSFDTKISSGVKWFDNLEWVHYLSSNEIDKIIDIINKYCLGEEYVIKTKSNCKKIILDTMKRISKT